MGDDRSSFRPFPSPLHFVHILASSLRNAYPYAIAMNLRARHTFAKRWKYRRADLQASSSTPTPDDERTKRRTFVSRTPDGFDAEEETIKIRSLFDLSIFPKVTKRKRERFFIATIVSTRRNRNSVTSFTYIYIFYIQRGTRSDQDS